MKYSTLPISFFEKIELNTLDSRAGRFNVQSDEHFIFSVEDKYRGIKKVFKKKEHPFFFTHEETLDIACEVYKKLYIEEPTSLYYFHDEDKTWNAFVVANEGVYLFDKNGELNHQSLLFQQKYYPLIGAFNGYGMEENPAFFMLTSSPFDKFNSSFLTIDSFRFLSGTEKEAMYKIKISDKPNTYRFKIDAINLFIEDVASKFKIKEEDFKILLETYQMIPLEKKYFMPIILDLYNQNRNIESVRNDSKLMKSIINLKKAAELQLRQSIHSLTWGSFISFIVHYNEFNLDSGIYPKADIEKLFSKKKAYTKFLEMFGKFRRDSKRFNNYAENQLEDWLKIEREIENGRWERTI